MELLYVHEHTSCYNYSAGIKPVIEKIVLKENQFENLNIKEFKIIIILTGSVVLFGLDEKLDTGSIRLVTTEREIRIQALETSAIIIFRLRAKLHLCESFSINKLFRKNCITDNVLQQQSKNTSKHLEANEIVCHYLKGLNISLDNGLKCSVYLNDKIRELLLLLRAYYAKEELAAFFYPLKNNDEEFATFIYNNYKKAKNTIELAEMAKYSISGFEKRFKSTFGMSAGKWMKQQKAMDVLHDINCSEKSLKEISFEYGFCSPSHLNKYCLKYLGQTPGTLREMKDRRKVS